MREGYWEERRHGAAPHDEYKRAQQCVGLGVVGGSGGARRVSGEVASGECCGRVTWQWSRKTTRGRCWVQPKWARCGAIAQMLALSFVAVAFADTTSR